MCRQLADRLLVPHVRTELGSGATKELIFFTGLGQLDLDATDRLAESVVDHRALVQAERPDSIAGTEEGEVSVHVSASVGRTAPSHDVTLQIEVSDSGVGIPADFSLGSGMGFHIMQYRARSMGARLEIKPIEPHGTRVTCYVRK